jgi:hypothetical protein
MAGAKKNGNNRDCSGANIDYEAEPWQLRASLIRRASGESKTAAKLDQTALLSRE